MKVTELLGGMKILEPRYFEDERGYYCESYSKRTLQGIGILDDFVQDNHFLSVKAGTVRGIHFQKNPAAQSKLIRCTRGSFMSVGVDLRKGSPTYKKWEAVMLSAENRKQFYIPRGFGHCCMSLEDMTEGQYKVDSLYAPDTEGAIRWNDPEIGIEWPDIPAVVSTKDQAASLLKDCEINFVYVKGID